MNAVCGTYAGLQQHTKGGTHKCLPCRVAASEYMKVWRGERKAKVSGDAEAMAWAAIRRARFQWAEDAVRTQGGMDS